METEKLNKLSARIYSWATKQGFWTSDVTINHSMALVITEIAEVIEADRNGRHADPEGFEKKIFTLDAGDPDYQAKWIAAFKDHLKDSVEDEMADTVIRILDIGGHMRLRWDKITASNYFREFRSFDMCENALALIVGFTNTKFVIQRRMLWAVLYVFKWFKSLRQNDDHGLLWYIDRKMDFNATRPKKNGKKY